LEGEGGQRLRLEKGRIRFGVQPRRPNEVFSVEFGSCKATVVGTAFTLQVDSLGAIASVEHGKVRIDALSGLSRLLTQGQSLSCRDLTQGPVHKNDAVEPIATPKPPVPVVAVPSSLEEQEWERLWSGCKQPSEKCTESLAAYLQSHPTGERAGKCAQLWADRSMARGDYRDALYALDLAAHANAGELSFKARLKACSIKAMELNQASQALKDLDALLVGLPEGVRKSAAMQLRADLVAREKNSGSDPANLP
jgi:hypothetical protein